MKPGNNAQEIKSNIEAITLKQAQEERRKEQTIRGDPVKLYEYLEIPFIAGCK